MNEQPMTGIRYRTRREFLMAGPAIAAFPLIGAGNEPAAPAETAADRPAEGGAEVLRTEVCVVGGGLSGVCAAIEAAREGRQVVLVQDRPVLGGNSSSEVRMHVCGADASGGRPHARETGILEEIRLENNARNPQRSASMWDLILWEKVRAEERIHLLLDTAMLGVEAAAGRVRSIEAVSSRTELRFRIEVPIFIDATGDASLAAKAGASFAVGQEARATYGESLAPETASPHTMGSTLLFQARDLGRPVPFEPPAYAYVYPTDADLPARGHGSKEYGYWWIEWGGEIDVIRDDARIREELLRCLLGVWDHVKNRGDHGAASWALEWFGFLPARRESRRVLGPYVLREDDLRSGRRFEDAVAYGGWPLDDHPPGGFKSKEPPARSIPLKDLYTIPLRSLYSRNVENLLVAGRAISASHVAFSSTRVMATCAVVGQAAGAAAAACVERGKLPAEIDAGEVRSVQQALLRADAYIPGLRNEDPKDLARSARLRASSSASGCGPEKAADGTARRVGDDAHAWWSAPLAEDPRPWLDAEIDRPALLGEVHLTFDSDLSKPMTLTHGDSYHRRMVQGVPSTLVADYRLEAWIDGAWRPVAEVKGNRERKRIHRAQASEAARLRIVCEATRGAPEARVQEVRWYG
jgi:hypothetical protein